MDYVICKKVLQGTTEKKNKKYLYDLLLPLTSNRNPHKVIKNIKILNEYSKIHDRDIKTWIDGLTNQNYWKDIECLDDPIFIKTCKKLTCGKLIVNEKEDYPNYEGLNPLDKDEAIEDIYPSGIHINQFGDGNLASTGDNSGNSIT